MTTETATRAASGNGAQVSEPNPEPESTARRVAESAHNLIDDTAAKAEDVERQLRRKAAAAGEKYVETKDSANKQVEQSLASVEDFVRERPITAAGIAFAAGVVASSILRR